MLRRQEVVAWNDDHVDAAGVHAMPHCFAQRCLLPLGVQRTEEFFDDGRRLPRLKRRSGFDLEVERTLDAVLLVDGQLRLSIDAAVGRRRFLRHEDVSKTESGGIAPKQIPEKPRGFQRFELGKFAQVWGEDAGFHILLLVRETRVEHD
ncbi:hypothetical protein D3C86_972770 [compost metagenome]